MNTKRSAMLVAAAMAIGGLAAFGDTRSGSLGRRGAYESGRRVSGGGCQVAGARAPDSRQPTPDSRSRHPAPVAHRPAPVGDDDFAQPLPEAMATRDPSTLTGTTSNPAAGTALDLAQALELALAHSPSLAATALGLEAAGQRQKQAGLLPNPELELEAEELTGPLSGAGSAEITAVISQQVPLGGKLGLQRCLSRAERDLAAGDLDAARLDLVAATTHRFWQVVLAQEQQTLQQEMLNLATSFADTVDKRVQAGKVSPMEATRARIEVATARVELEHRNSELQVARDRLASVWGAGEAHFARAAGPLPRAVPPPPLAALQALLADTPEVHRLEDEIRVRQTVLRLARAERIPDVTLSAGPRRLRAEGLTTWVAGISLPLPVFDRNQGERRAASIEVEQARRLAQALRADLETRLAGARQQLQALALQVRVLEDEVIPAATDVLAATRLGYREGKLSFLEVLDARRTLSEARQQRLAALASFLAVRTETERLVGRMLDELPAARKES